MYLGLAVADATKPDFIAFATLDALLGGSFASRITSNIRSRKDIPTLPTAR